MRAVRAVEAVRAVRAVEAVRAVGAVEAVEAVKAADEVYAALPPVHGAQPMMSDEPPIVRWPSALGAGPHEPGY